MPSVLLAGQVASKPKANPFPATGRPRVTIDVDVDGRRFLVVGYNDTMAELEALVPGDSVSIQGALVIETGSNGAISGLHIEAAQTLALRKRSMNRSAPVQLARGKLL
jgi:hypothetical protein